MSGVIPPVLCVTHKGSMVHIGLGAFCGMYTVSYR